LILEITETTILSDLDISMDVLTRLRIKGFKLSIDDFGTGYSSMEQLQRIPFGELKIDRSFVQGAAERPAVRAILAASINMAHKLDLITVAEGVETQADLDLIRGLGCDLVQGWLIAKAMPVAELIVWLQQRTAE
jgi:EAL domain-containing protein (putative c-di-GMP-specific phosphodiesterase class I)